jgi:hypothetical protein
MTKLGSSTTICWVFLGALVLATISLAQTRAPIAEQLAKKYGLDSFGQVEAIRYTFHLQFPEWMSPAHGFGSPRRIKSRTRERTRTASR